jgi:5'-nucleotidase
VALGAHHWEKVDLVLSGLNLGLNLGNAIWHSGTLAAAKQAVRPERRCLECAGGRRAYFESLKPWIRQVLQTLVDETLPLVNVNFPRQPRGLVWTRVSVRRYDGRIVPTTDPLGRELFWFTVVPMEGAEEGTDRWAVEQSWISLTSQTRFNGRRATCQGLRAPTVGRSHSRDGLARYLVSGSSTDRS